MNVLDGFAGEPTAPFLSQLRPVLSSPSQITQWLSACREAGQQLPVGLHIDTGMSRLGLAPEELTGCASDGSLAALAVAFVMTHPACADDENDAMTMAQWVQFKELVQLFPGKPQSFANSAAILADPMFHCDLVRPGIALYGGRAINNRPNPMRPVVQLYARVLQVREVPAGTPVGYGATFETERPSRLATLGAGYADGYPRAAGAALQGLGGNHPHVRFGDHIAPMVGRISMDTMVVDITDLPDGGATDGVMAQLIGPDIGVDDVADWAGTIGYEVLTGLKTARAHRIWLGAE